MAKIELILGDCLMEMKKIPDKSIDLVLTDPPYGIGQHGGVFRARKGQYKKVFEKGNWDNKRPDKIYFDEMIRVSKNQIIFGGNYFTDYLPVSRGWIYWGKKMGGDFSDGELAWTSYDRVLKEFQFCNKFHGKEHPTQKPIELIKWCIQQADYWDIPQTILDPFAGSFTTAVACKKLKRNCIAIEVNPKYYEIGKKRVDNTIEPML